MTANDTLITGTVATDAVFLYRQIALRVAQTIAGSVLKPGQRLPSVRDCAVQNGVSISTVVQAYGYLEEHRLVQPRPKAGYFVTATSQAKAAALVGSLQATSTAVSAPTTPPPATPTTTVNATTVTTVASFAGYTPKDNHFFDGDRIRVALSRATRVKRDTLMAYSNGVGTLALRNAVALRALHLGCALQADNIVITASCIHAVSMCLQTVTQPGDLVAIESPTFFGFLDLLASLNLKTLVLPTDARTGISLPALQLALETQTVRAILLVPTLSNPLGSVMPLAQKRALAQLVAQHQVPLIEDVVFNDLLATDARRKAVKAFDTQGWVMTCGSFAKTVAPGIRLGWVEGGRWSAALAKLKKIQGTATNAVLEHALADLLTQGNYEAHLRRLSALMKQRLAHARRLIQSSFPAGTKVYDPPAGYTLWVALPSHLDSMALFHRCKAQGITIGPGHLFCASARYQHCLRLSFAGPWGNIEQDALQRVGELATAMATTRVMDAVSGLPDQTGTGSSTGSRSDLMSDERVSAHDLW